MKPIDSFTRTPPRRYDKPREEPPDDGRTAWDAHRAKRYYEAPRLTRSGMERGLSLTACVLFILLFCRSAAPWGEAPDVQTRFAQWAARENEKLVSALPGATPAPQSEIAQRLALASAAPLPAATAAPTSAPQQQGGALRHYADGELSYHTDRLDVEIVQRKKDGMTYFVCDIRLSDPTQLRTAFAGDDFKSGIYEATSDIAARYSPVLAINGDFCRYHRKGVIIRNGELLRKQNITNHHLMVVSKTGELSALTDRSGKQGLVADGLVREGAWQTFEFGPVLVANGQPATLPNRFTINTHEGYYEPRTAIGQISPLHYLVIVVDGRREGYSTGASLPQLQQLFLDEGVQFAFNLDGGGSTSLVFLGQVVNMPSGGKERSISDIVMFMPNPMPPM